MEVKPARTNEKPSYPQKVHVCVADLKRSIPKRWTNTAGRFALGVLALFLLTGCQDESAVKPQPSREPTNTAVCTPGDGISDVIIVDGKEVEVITGPTYGLPAPPKFITFFENIFDSIFDFFDGAN